MEDEDFNRLLLEILDTESPQTLISIPGVYELLAEYYNNDVLDMWKEECLAAAEEREEQEEYYRRR